MPSNTANPARPLRADARRNYERLLYAAKAAFTEQGAEASLDEIARQAGVGVGTLYRHFPTRAALLGASIRSSLDELRGLGQKLLSAPAPGDALDLWLRAAVAHACTYRGLATSLLSSMYDEGSELYTSCKAMQLSGQQVLERAQQAGVARPEATAGDLFALVTAVAWASEQATDDPGQADRLLALLRGGLQC